LAQDRLVRVCVRVSLVTMDELHTHNTPSRRLRFGQPVETGYESSECECKYTRSDVRALRDSSEVANSSHPLQLRSRKRDTNTGAIIILVDF
jgi:hypothetical protein